MKSNMRAKIVVTLTSSVLTLASVAAYVLPPGYVGLPIH